MKKIIFSLIICILALFVCACNSSTAPAAVSLSEGYKSQITEYSYYPDDFVLNQEKLALRIFCEVNKQSTDTNVIISPVSISNIFGMLYFGSDGATNDEFKSALTYTSSVYNHSLYTLLNELSGSGKIINQNSVWIKSDENFSVKNDYLQGNADFYGADIFKMPFTENAAININDWAKKSTNGKIDGIINKIDKNACMYLINAFTFDDEWDTPYTTADVASDVFYLKNGTVEVEMMHSTESFYIKTSHAEGFIKNYKNGNYKFIALLPNSDIDIDEYISLLQSTDFNALVNSATQKSVNCVIPKFKSEFQVSLNKAMQSMGIKSAFNAQTANFEKIGSYQNANLYLSEVLQKAYITVDEKGTKAGAVTKAEIAAKTSLEIPDTSVILNRPFVYAVLEAKTNMPLFIGKTVNP